jgi:hypothetical protein
MCLSVLSENDSSFPKVEKGISNLLKCCSPDEAFRGRSHFVCESAMLEASWNMMAHEQKPDFIFRRNGRVHLNWRGASVQSTTGSRGVRISGSNAGYTMFRGSVKGTGYPLHSLVSPSLPHPCVTVYHHISTGVYHSLPSAVRLDSVYWVDKFAIKYVNITIINIPDFSRGLVVVKKTDIVDDRQSK